MFSIRLVAIAVLLTTAVVVRPAVAQNTVPPVDLFAGYSLLPANGDDFPRQTSHGVQGTVAFNVNRWFGVIGDVAMQFNTTRDLGPGFEGLEARSTVREFLVGPRFTARSDRADAFVHGLFGVSTGDAGPDFKGFSDSGMTFGGGGGVDVHLTPRVSARATFDLIGSFADIVEGNSRFGAGLVVKLGR